MAANCTPDRQQGGFTLIELLVVLLIIAALLTIVPSITAGLPALRLRAAADGLVQRMQALRDQALRRGAATELTLDPVGRRYTTTFTPVPVAFPPVVEQVGISTASPLPLGRDPEIHFYPDGSATATTIRLTHGWVVEVIAIDWLTGRIARHAAR